MLLVDRSDIVGQGQGEFALPGDQRTGESSTTEDFYRRVIGEGEVVVGGFERGREGFQLLVTADELDGIDFGGYLRSGDERMRRLERTVARRRE